MSNVSKAAAELGRKGGVGCSPAKRAAILKNLQKARKNRWKKKIAK